MFGRIVTALITITVTLTSCSPNRPDAAAAPDATGNRINVSVGQCGTGWTHAVAGQQHFVLANTDTRAGEVLLTDAKTAAVFADVEPVAPGTTANLDIALGSGNYAFRCAMEDESTVVGRTVTIPGTTPQPVAPVLPVTQGDLIEATQAYQKYVTGRIPQLVRLTTTLRTTIKDGDLSAARRAWLPAHLAYERLGAAYDAFGDLDSAINGLPDGLPGGVRDRDWTGFHRVEYGLWQHESAASLLVAATALRKEVRALGAEFSQEQIDPLTLSIRAHEITENALQFELTGRTDFGSGSSLATVRANLDGTQVVLNIIKPLLSPRYTPTPTLDQTLTQTKTDLAHLPPLTKLTRAERERVNSDLSQLSELLAPVAAILEPRRNS
jgi:iron uptake system component EfeO